MIKDTCSKYSSIFGRLFDSDNQTVEKPLLNDVELLLNKLNDKKNKEFYE